MPIWTIIGGIVALASFITTVSSLIAKRIRQNTEAQTRVAVTLEKIGKDLEKTNEHNSKAHKEFYEKLEDHEGRLRVLEDNK